ncbi:MAG: LCP family protein [Rubrobacteraceae bacterium]
MGRDRGGRRSSARRGRRSDPRLRGLSYEERRRVYIRRRIVAGAIIVVLLLLLAILVGLIPLFGGSETGKASAENASNKLNLDQNVARKPQTEPVAEKQNVTKPAATPTEAAQGKAEENAGGEPLDVLVLGVDRRPEGSSVEGSRADTIMVARITPGTGSVEMISIPRDLFVEIEPGVEDRINAAYSYGGVEQMTGAVEEATGISIDRYAVVDFEGFKDIVDAVDGLKVEIQGEMPPRRHMQGIQTLDGEQALFYARYRGTAGSDLDRIARQQQLVGALREKLVSWGAVSKLPGIMEAIHGNLETDLGLLQNISLSRSLLNAEDAASFEAFQLAGVPTTLPDGRQVLVPDSAENERILQEFRGKSPST